MGKRDPAWKEMKGGLAAADTRRHLPRRAGGPAAGMSLSPRALRPGCAVPCQQLPARRGAPCSPRPGTEPPGPLYRSRTGPGSPSHLPPALFQQIPCALTHPRVLTARSRLARTPCPVPKTSPGNLLVFPIPLSPAPGHGHWPCCHLEEVTKLVQESPAGASRGPHPLFEAGRGEIACHQPPCRLATSLPGRQ